MSLGEEEEGELNRSGVKCKVGVVEGPSRSRSKKKKRKKEEPSNFIKNFLSRFLSLLSLSLLKEGAFFKMSLQRDESTPSFSKAKDGGLTVVREREKKECRRRWSDSGSG